MPYHFPQGFKFTEEEQSALIEIHINEYAILLTKDVLAVDPTANPEELISYHRQTIRAFFESRPAYIPVSDERLQNVKNRSIQQPDEGVA